MKSTIRFAEEGRSGMPRNASKVKKGSEAAQKQKRVKRAEKASHLQGEEEEQLASRVERLTRSPEHLSQSDVLALQRGVSNRAVAGVLGGARPAPSRKYEREAGSEVDLVKADAGGDWDLTTRAGEHGLAHEMALSLQRAAALIQRQDDVTSTRISETTDTGNKYTQELVLNKTKARITVELGVNWGKKGTWASDDAFNRFVRKVKTAAYSYLDNKFKVVCTPVAAAAGPLPVELPIDFLIYDIDWGYSIDAFGGTPGGDSAMSTTGGKIYEYTSDDTPEEDITFAHEFGHAILGASDEYANPAVPNRVLSNDHSIMANYYTQGKTQAAFKARHFQHIVTEVAKAFAGYSCGIQEM
jgi:hypothetical protein